ncbi:hypothetical protein PL2TA16_00671 [Pseudoalteromonas luteoviolacea 2ta16]|uniref:Uncharacterized protein n=1 Tax=Pseudoalteromonas luteoviolacea (strain 2ta16) TaxID=1353533 RepID=V4HB14_PSEL2|nr:hypothetical protein PL2TA16_00671 [Pseudoalteromonas luteoviolacea 2ta16]
MIKSFTILKPKFLKENPEIVICDIGDFGDYFYSYFKGGKRHYNLLTV